MTASELLMVLLVFVVLPSLARGGGLSGQDTLVMAQFADRGQQPAQRNPLGLNDPIAGRGLVPSGVGDYLTGDKVELTGLVQVVAVGLPGLVLGCAGRTVPSAFAGDPPTALWRQREIGDEKRAVHRRAGGDAGAS